MDMKTTMDTERTALEKYWEIKPYSKQELAQAYAPDIAPTSALNRLARWIKLNKALCAFGQALKRGPALVVS